MQSSFIILFMTRWMDGSFVELDSESIEGEADEYWREIYKITKTFNAQKKKEEAERAKNAPAKKKKGDDEVKEPEEKKEELASLKVCNTVSEQIKEFKVRHCEGGAGKGRGLLQLHKGEIGGET